MTWGGFDWLKDIWKMLFRALLFLSSKKIYLYFYQHYYQLFCFCFCNIVISSFSCNEQINIDNENILLHISVLCFLSGFSDGKMMGFQPIRRRQEGSNNQWQSLFQTLLPYWTFLDNYLSTSASTQLDWKCKHSDGRREKCEGLWLAMIVKTAPSLVIYSTMSATRKILTIQTLPLMLAVNVFSKRTNTNAEITKLYP